jgi:hypothetical protein
MCISVHVKYPLFLSDFNLKLDFPQLFWKKAQISNFIKIRPAEELFHAGGWTDRQT